MTGTGPGEHALYDGIPSWLAGSIRDWLAGALTYRDTWENLHVREDRVREMERRLRIELVGKDFDAALDHLWRLLGSDQDLLLRAIDVALMWCDGTDGLQHDARRVADLARFLTEGGSAWRVALDDQRRARLERRVPDVVVSAAQAAISGPDKAAEHLRLAWHAMYGRDPNPGEAYSEAVKAVEAAAIPTVCPNDTSATLGGIIGLMRSNPEDWEVVLTPRDRNGVPRLVGMLELLWEAHRRHGTPDPSVPVTMSPGEAEAAVHLAVTAVQWFATGAVRRA